MPFARPTLTQLRQQARQAITTNVPGADGLLRTSNLGVLGDVAAGMAHQHYGYLDYIALQATPFTATDEYLAAWGALKQITRKPANVATGTVTFPATSSATAIPAGTPVTRSDGVTGTVLAVIQQTASSMTVQVSITADPYGLTGAFGNSVANTSFTLGTSVPGVTSTSSAASAFTGGADIETVDALRARIVGAYQQTAQGGSSNDYVQWALQVPGVTRAWCVPLFNGPGTVAVYFMMDSAEAAFQGVPQGSDGVASNESRDVSATGDQLTVANALFPQRPVTALVHAKAPRLQSVAMSIKGVAVANRTAVQTALASMLQQQTLGGVVQIKSFWTAAASADPVDDFNILSPTTDIVLGAGQLPTLGTITWS